MWETFLWSERWARLWAKGSRSPKCDLEVPIIHLGNSYLISQIINRTNLLWMLLERQVQCLNQDKIKANCWCYSQAASRESNLKVGGHQRNDSREDRCVPPGPTHLVPPGTRFLILTCSGILKTSRIGDTLSSCFFIARSFLLISFPSFSLDKSHIRTNVIQFFVTKCIFLPFFEIPASSCYWMSTK